ncbi:MAG: hypothetical protein K2M98_05695, partial [Muribaculum sp.]|nr:hypothetical protein [Muribaculum sp.]
IMMVALAVDVSAQSVRDLQSDTWVGIDALNRTMPTAADVQLKTDKDRIVSIFYVTWHSDSYHTSENGYYGGDVTKVLQNDPSARFNKYHPGWVAHMNHWGEPEEGYFLSTDPYIIRKDISMLNDAGVDMLVLDCTNGVMYYDEWNALFNVLVQMKSEGSKTPKVCFWVYNNEPCVRAYNIYNYYYKSRWTQYKDHFFYLDGKPLLLCNMNPRYDSHCSLLASDTDYRFEHYTSEVINFFTMRNMWWGYYYWPLDANDSDHVYVGSENNWSFGYDMQDIRINLWDGSTRASYHNGEIEQMAVTPAQHAINMIGKSWKMKSGKGVSPNDYSLNEYDMPKRKYDSKKKIWLEHPEDHGIYFEDRWDEALATDPKFIFINDWNEWTAGIWDASGPYMNHQANYMFVDQYNAEFNRTIMPMKDGYTDNYYMQMAQNIRRYKGVRQAPVAETKVSLRAADDFAKWADVGEEYFDTYGDVEHRDYPGYGGMHYINNSGRNDFIAAKVAVDNTVMSFYVETASAITPYTDSNWMMLFINTDRDFSTGWAGFDYMID